MKSFESKKDIPEVNLLYLIIGLIIFGIIAVNIGINLIWVNSFVGNLEDRTINYLVTEASRAAENVEGSIDKELSDIKKLSQDIAIAKNPDDIEFFVSQYLKDNLAIKEVSIVDLVGQEQYRYSRGKYFTGKDLRDFSSLEEFEMAKQGETFISMVGFTPEAEPFIEITTPIRKLDVNDPKAVLRVVFYIRGTWNKALEMKIGRTGKVSIIDDKGMLIAHPNPSRVLSKVNLLSLPPTKSLIMGEVFGGAKYLNEEGKEVIGVGAPIKRLKWGVIIEQEASESEALIGEVERFVMIFLGGGIVIIGILIWLIFVLKRANRELIKRHYAIEVQTGELEKMKNLLEIKVNARTKELKELAESLEEQVKGRTKELRGKMEELEKFNRLATGRELKMVELKKELKELAEKLKKYKESGMEK